MNEESNQQQQMLNSESDMSIQKAESSENLEKKYPIDQIDSIPNHIKRYIEHLYQKKKVTPTVTESQVQVSRSTSKRSFFDVVAELGRQHGLSKVQAICNQTDQYLGDLYNSSIQLIDNVHKKVIEQQNQKSSQLLTNSIEEIQNSGFGSETEVDLVEMVNNTAKKMVDHLNKLIGPTIDFEKANFFERQQYYDQLKSSRIKQKKQEIENHQKKECTHSPQINKKKNLVNSYYRKQIENQNGQMLKMLHKSCQTIEKLNMKIDRVHHKQDKKDIQKSIQKKNLHESDEQQYKNKEVQTDFQNELHYRKTSRNQKYPDTYIPIQDRVAYILLAKQQKIDEQLELIEKQKEAEFAKLTFCPNQSVNQDPVSRKQINEFFESQQTWKHRLEEEIIKQKVNVEFPNYTYRPEITNKPKYQKETKMPCNSMSSSKMETNSKIYYHPSSSQKSMDIVRRILFEENHENHKHSKQKQYNYYLC